MKKIIMFIFIINSLFAMDLEKYGIVFSSANMEFVMAKIFKAFYAKYPNDHILVQYDSPGKLANKIIHDVPYDMFLSANKKFAEEIYKAHKAVTKPKLYTRGALIIFYKFLVYNKGYNFLTDKKIQKILVGNAKNAVYGSRSVEVLKNLHLYNKIKSKIEYRRNIAEVVDDAVWAKSKVGFIPKSAINILPRGYDQEGVTWREINPKLYTPILQYFVISKRGMKKQSIKDFTNFLLSKEGQKILTSNGYLPIK